MFWLVSRFTSHRVQVSLSAWSCLHIAQGLSHSKVRVGLPLLSALHRFPSPIARWSKIRSWSKIRTSPTWSQTGRSSIAGDRRGPVLYLQLTSSGSVQYLVDILRHKYTLIEREVSDSHGLSTTRQTGGIETVQARVDCRGDEALAGGVGCWSGEIAFRGDCKSHKLVLQAIRCSAQNGPPDSEKRFFGHINGFKLP